MTTDNSKFSNHIVAEAFQSWLLGPGRAPEYLPLQQLFSLCYAGFLPRQTAESRTDVGLSAASRAAQRPVPALSTALVRLLDGCFTAAAALPDFLDRRRAASNTVAAFCRAALREAQSRGGASSITGIGTYANGHASSSGCGGCVDDDGSCRTSMDRDLLDAAFTLLVAVASRHAVIAEDLQLMEVAWGAAAGPPPPLKPTAAGEGAGAGAIDEQQRGHGAALLTGATEVPQPNGNLAEHSWAPTFTSGGVASSAVVVPAGEGVTPDAGGVWEPWAAPDPHGSHDEPTVENVTEFFLSDEFQCKLAAGQLLYGKSYGDGGGGAGNGAADVTRRDGVLMRPTGVARCGRTERGEHQNAAGVKPSAAEDEDDLEEVLALCEVPALADLCATAAAADFWPEVIGCVAEGGSEAFVRWLYGKRELPVFPYDFDRGDDPVNGCDASWVRARLMGSSPVPAAASAEHLGGPSFACCTRLTAAINLQPGVVLSAVPPELLAVLALRHQRVVMPAVVRGVASVIGGVTESGTSPADTAVVSEAQTGQSSSDQAFTRLKSCVRRLGSCLAVLGCDLGELLQGHLL